MLCRWQARCRPRPRLSGWTLSSVRRPSVQKLISFWSPSEPRLSRERRPSVLKL